MITLRILTYVTGTTAVAGLVFGWATPLFAVGMIAVPVWLILYMLLVYLDEDHLDQVMANYQPPTHADFDDELPYRLYEPRPTWDANLGSIE